VDVEPQYKNDVHLPQVGICQSDGGVGFVATVTRGRLPPLEVFTLIYEGKSVGQI